MVFNIVAFCAAVIQFSLGIVAATNDRLDRDERLSDSTMIHISRYDIYYSHLADWFPCDVVYGWVGVLLASS